MRRSRPFDHSAEHAPSEHDLTEEFWGTSRAWDGPHDSGAVGQPAPGDDETTGAIRAIRDGMTAFRPQRLDRREPTGRIRRTRVHGATPRVPAVPSDTTPIRERSLGELAGGTPADHGSNEADVVGRYRSGIEPRIHADRDHGHASDHDHDHDHGFAHDHGHRFERAHDHGFDVTDGFDRDDRFDYGGNDVALRPASVLGERLGVGAVDPLLVRIGAILLVGMLLVPVALSLRPADAAGDSVRTDQSVQTPVASGASPVIGDASTESATVASASVDADGSSSAAAIVGESADGAAPPASEPDVSAAVASGASDVEVAAAGETEPTSEPDDGASVEVRDAAPDDSGSAPAEPNPSDAPSAALAEPAIVDDEAERLVPSCPQSYPAAPGDSWYRIADAAGISPSVLLEQNRATAETVILPGDEICLPSDASMPVAPTTSVATTTTEPTTTAPSTTAAPTTTAAPVTRSTSPSAPASVDEIKRLIRDTWPADQHDMALFIADRESGFDPRADNNFCCYGVFQMYYEVHRRWLDDFGVYEASDLFDAEKNIAAAYHLYQRSGGWGPWGY